MFWRQDSSENIERIRDEDYERDNPAHQEKCAALQTKLLEKFSFQIMGRARQTVLSYAFHLFLLSIFLILLVLRKKGLDAIEVEIVLIPLVIDSL